MNGFFSQLRDEGGGVSRKSADDKKENEILIIPVTSTASV